MPTSTGREDFRMWCKIADAGGRGVHVPQVLGWHQRAKDSITAQVDSPAPRKPIRRARSTRVIGDLDRG